ncbi:MAG TPA: hypothetical protein VFX70_20195 [Mycobacteriales bacterium]|nr:hypothetical protein [Mycobacteriales bacterium]
MAAVGGTARRRRTRTAGGVPQRRVWSVAEVRALGVRTDLVTAGQVLGIGRTVAHQLARRGDFPVPVLRVGHKYVVPVAPLLELLGVPAGTDPAGAAW